MTLTDMDYVRAAIANAIFEDVSIDDLYLCAEYAETAEAFDDAVNMLTYTVPDMEGGDAYG